MHRLVRSTRGWALLLVSALLLAPPPAKAATLDLVGTYDPGTPGFNASVAGLDDVAFLGSWGSTTQCPGLGVRIVSLRDPAAPAPLGVAADYPGTTAEHLAPVHLDGPSFTGSALLAGIQRCADVGGAEGGLAIWDATDPTHPRELSFLPTGRAVRGVHEFTLGQQGDRWYAYLAVPNSEISDGRGDLRVVDVTDPTQPVEVADWGARRDAGLPVGFGAQCAPECRGALPQAFLHSVALSPDRRTAYLSYWDLGMILLDVSEPGAPRLLGRFAEPLGDEGNTHSVSLAQGGRLALVADETFGPPWGGLRLVDVQDPANPVQVGSFQTTHSAAGTPGPQYAYSIHNPLVDDRDPSQAYLAWYADGVRLLDVSDASAPVEIASWVPPGDPLVWNVALLGDLLLAGDVNGGLYVVRR